MTTKKELLLDVDGVIRNPVDVILKIYNEQYDPEANIKYEDIRLYDMSKILVKTPDIVDTYFRKHAKEVFETSKPYEADFAQTLEKIKEQYKVHILTYQFLGNEKYTLNWFEEYKVPYDSMLFTPHKEIIKGDVFLDDATHNLERVSENGTRVICMDHKSPHRNMWNQEWQGERVYSLKELADLILE